MSAPLRPRQCQTPQARQWFILAGVTFATLASGAEVVVQPGQTVPQADGSLRTEILSGLNAGDQVIRPVLTQGAGQ